MFYKETILKETMISLSHLMEYYTAIEMVVNTECKIVYVHMYVQYTNISLLLRML